MIKASKGITTEGAKILTKGTTLLEQCTDATFRVSSASATTQRLYTGQHIAARATGDSDRRQNSAARATLLSLENTACHQ